MSANTANGHGRISISEDAIAQVASAAALDCYGIVGIMSKRLSDTFGRFKRRAKSSGAKVICSGDRIFLDLYVVVKYGLSIEAVADALRTSIKYAVEKFTGMIVDTVNVNVVDTKI